ncbi:hypothetical protein QBC46DRAFT_376428 [Diplogelasinospora grovesii]|uniref:Alpha-1,3-mannosyltransferase n=1 Tax=Diplogelasinospora grovesii TaxID=303347 RepID=A0AAN6NDN9_9PEZI|nr:hypothetical protein QBC46DRAFT_376428 [Diplogelasinospora grovesii]
MPPPHLHPRSRMTSSLFATTVLASFFVVGLPHVLPCPAPRTVYADGEVSADGTTPVKRRRRRRCTNTDQAAAAPAADTIREEGSVVEFEGSNETETRESRLAKSKRECPVPKPGGILGDLLGFRKEESTENKDPRAEPNR